MDLDNRLNGAEAWGASEFPTGIPTATYVSGMLTPGTTQRLALGLGPVALFAFADGFNKSSVREIKFNEKIWEAEKSKSTQNTVQKCTSGSGDTIKVTFLDGTVQSHDMGYGGTIEFVTSGTYIIKPNKL
jgi:hypothetical protein